MAKTYHDQWFDRASLDVTLLLQHPLFCSLQTRLRAYQAISLSEGVRAHDKRYTKREMKKSRVASCTKSCLNYFTLFSWDKKNVEGEISVAFLLCNNCSIFAYKAECGLIDKMIPICTSTIWKGNPSLFPFPFSSSSPFPFPLLSSPLHFYKRS